MLKPRYLLPDTSYIWTQTYNMQKLMIICSLALVLASCQKTKTAIAHDEPKTVPVFPLKEGNSWQYIVTRYFQDGSVQSEESYNDTITETKMIDGIVFSALAGSYYHLVGFESVEIEGDRSAAGWEHKYECYKYVDAIDTLWRTITYKYHSQGDSSYCIAYPYDTEINGSICRRTEIRTYYENELQSFILSKVVRYFSLGKGPIFEQYFENDGTILYKMKEVRYSPVSVSYE